MILSPDQPGALLSPATAAFIQQHCNLSTLRVKALNSDIDGRIARELLDLREVALMHNPPALSLPLPQSEAGSPEVAPGLELLSTTAVAGQLNISDRAVRLACTTGRLDGEKVGGQWWVTPEAFKNFKAARTGAGHG